MRMPKYECKTWHTTLDVDLTGSRYEFRHFDTIEEAQNFMQRKYLLAIKGLETIGLVEKKTSSASLIFQQVCLEQLFILNH